MLGYAPPTLGEGESMSRLFDAGASDFNLQLHITKSSYFLVFPAFDLLGRSDVCGVRGGAGS